MSEKNITMTDHITSPIIFTWPSQRIDQRLTQHFPYSRNFFHHIITRKGIMVNDKPVKKSYKLKDQDTIVIDDLQRYLWPALLEESPNIVIPIVLEQEDYLIINKPKWVLSHPNSIRDVASPSVVGFLYHRYKNLPSIWNFIRAGLIHRLDRDTNGLMIVAKTEKWLAHFKQLFQQKSWAENREEKEKVPLKKCYHAVCHLTEKWRKSVKNWDTIWLPYYIIQDVVPNVPHPVIKLGMTKILSYTQTSQEKSSNLMSCEIEILTGRTHQIRYHLAKQGLPIVGDYLYWKWDEEDIQLQLTAKKLAFQDIYTNKMITIEI